MAEQFLSYRVTLRLFAIKYADVINVDCRLLICNFTAIIYFSYGNKTYPTCFTGF